MSSATGDGQIQAHKVVTQPIWYIKHSDAEFPSSLLKSNYDLSSQFNFLIIPNMSFLLYIVQSQFYSSSEHRYYTKMTWQLITLSWKFCLMIFVSRLSFGFYFLGLCQESLSMPNLNEYINDLDRLLSFFFCYCLFPMLLSLTIFIDQYYLLTLTDK